LKKSPASGQLLLLAKFSLLSLFFGFEIEYAPRTFEGFHFSISECHLNITLMFPSEILNE
jgi:hypothetical protein